MYKSLKLIIGIVLICSNSCTSNEDIASEDIEVKEVLLSAPDLDTNTRSSLIDSNPSADQLSLAFSWAKGDVVGICPSSGDQLSFAIPEKDAGTAKASFDGGGWRTKSGYTYTAYYPFNREAFLGDLSAIPISLVGQTQNGNMSYDHLGKYDFMVSAPSSSEDGGISFSLRRIGLVMKFIFTLPEAGSFSQLRVKSDNVKFVTKASFDAITGCKSYDATNQVGTFEMTPIEYSQEAVLYLKNFSTSNAAEKLVMYMMVYPSDFTGSKYSFSVLSEISKGMYKEYLMSYGANGAKRYSNKGVYYSRPNSTYTTFEIIEHPASDYPYPPQDGISGSADNFIKVGG